MNGPETLYWRSFRGVIKIKIKGNCLKSAETKTRQGETYLTAIALTIFIRNIAHGFNT